MILFKRGNQSPGTKLTPKNPRESCRFLDARAEVAWAEAASSFGRCRDPLGAYLEDRGRKAFLEYRRLVFADTTVVSADDDTDLGDVLTLDYSVVVADHSFDEVEVKMPPNRKKL